jgi:hypothetical protein
VWRIWPEIELPVNLQSLDLLPEGLHGSVIMCVGTDECRGKASVYSTESVDTELYGPVLSVQNI